MLFLDTSALVKRYVDEEETPRVLAWMEFDGEWAASALAAAELRVTLCHVLTQPALLEAQDAFARDWSRFHVVPVDDLCLETAARIGCSERTRTLDAVHLAAAARLPPRPTFATFDRRQQEAAEALRFALPPA